MLHLRFAGIRLLRPYLRMCKLVRAGQVAYFDIRVTRNEVRVLRNYVIGKRSAGRSGRLMSSQTAMPTPVLSNTSRLGFTSAVRSL